ncbi:MAG: hypothetical protein M1165_02380 [Candidatus Pacearchaeota archaeon]|nr:hypothetical protein [Candidatus Pacearchaeota archaeon]
MRELNRILGKKVRIIFSPTGIHEVGEFIKAIIDPVEFQSIEVRENEIIIRAGAKNKAALIGREKRRFLEMKKIVKDFFGKELTIV